MSSRVEKVAVTVPLQRAFVVVRLLVLAALLLASLGMTPAMAAGTAGAMHRGMDAQHSRSHEYGTHDGTQNGPADAVAHSCPGCAVFVSTAEFAAEAPRIPLPDLPTDPLQPASIVTSPIPPPPRTS